MAGIKRKASEIYGRGECNKTLDFLSPSTSGRSWALDVLSCGRGSTLAPLIQCPAEGRWICQRAVKPEPGAALAATGVRVEWCSFRFTTAGAPEKYSGKL